MDVGQNPLQGLHKAAAQGDHIGIMRIMKVYRKKFYLTENLNNFALCYFSATGARCSNQ